MCVKYIYMCVCVCVCTFCLFVCINDLGSYHGDVKNVFYSYITINEMKVGSLQRVDVLPQSWSRCVHFVNAAQGHQPRAGHEAGRHSPEH